MGADKREPQERITAYAVSRYCIPRAVFLPSGRSGFTRAGAHTYAQTHTRTCIYTRIYTHTPTCIRTHPRVLFACGARLRARPSKGFRRSSFSEPHSLMNSYLFLDRVPSESLPRGGARIRSLFSPDVFAGTGTRHFRRSFLVFPSRALSRPAECSRHYYLALIPH